MTIGIEKMNLYTGSLFLDLERLAIARGKDAGYYKKELLLDKKSQNVDYEDVITMAVNAAMPIIDDRDREAIELCIFATESGLDYCKSNSTYVCKYLGLKPQVRNFEIKNACYATTCALQMAAGWIASGVSPGKKALIVSSDVSYNTEGRVGEEVPGLGAVALLVSDTPQIVELELGKVGYFTFEGTDYARPTATYDIIRGRQSLYAYLDCLEGAWAHYKTKVGEIDFSSYFQRVIYHTPFAGLVKMGHTRLLEDSYGKLKKSEREASFAEKVAPSLRISQAIGNAYSSAVYICLMSLLEYDEDLHPGDRIGVYSYGSGSCAEFYSVLVLPEAKERIAALTIQQHLEDRYELSVTAFDELARRAMQHALNPDFETDISQPPGWYETHYKDRGYLILRGAREYLREYAWS